MVRRGIQSRGLDLIFGEAEPRTQPDRIIKVKEPVILYGRDDVNPASKNFTKYPNEIHPVMQSVLKGEEAAAVAFIYLWRVSFGYGRNYCRVSLQTIEQETVIGSRKTVQRAINLLSAATFIVKGRLESGAQDKTQKGCLYRVLTPEEIANMITEEGVPFDDIPSKGVVILTRPNLSPPPDPRRNRGLSGRVKLGGDKMTPGQNGTTHFDTTSGDNLARNKLTPPSEKRINKQSGKWEQNDTTQNDTPFKEDNIKDSLSLNIIQLFYTGIGQTEISTQKRESASSVFQELIKDGFTPDDIQFAVDWTLKNAKEKLYDFSIIQHTIGQAMADKAASEKREAEQRINIEAEQKRVEHEQRIREYKDNLSMTKRKTLRKQAEKEIRQSGEFKAEFVTEFLIAAKENEILEKEGR